MVVSGTEESRMAVQKGKKRRRPRRRDRDGEEYTPIEMPAPTSASTSGPRRRGGKPLKERSPVVAALIAVFCVIGAGLTAYTSRNQLATHKIDFLFIGLYPVLAAVQAFLAFQIYKAKGGWR
jgi:hypothetical protein